jgi:hypothetical protein
MVKLGVIPMVSLVPDDSEDSSTSRPTVDIKLGDTTVVGRKDVDKNDSKLSKVLRIRTIEDIYVISNLFPSQALFRISSVSENQVSITRVGRSTVRWRLESSSTVHVTVVYVSCRFTSFRKAKQEG